MRLLPITEHRHGPQSQQRHAPHPLHVHAELFRRLHLLVDLLGSLLFGCTDRREQEAVQASETALDPMHTHDLLDAIDRRRVAAVMEPRQLLAAQVYQF